MAVTGKIADGIIQIALAGYEKVKEQLNAVKGQLGQMKNGLDTLTSASAKGFAVASAGILGFLKAADPVRFTIFTQKLEVLAIHIGRTFIPLLESAIKWIDKLIAYFSKLSDGQRDNILHWSKIGLLILGVGTAIGKAISLISSLWSLISAGVGVVRPLVEILSKIIPIGKVLRLLTLGFLLFNGEAGRATELFGKLKEMALPALESLWGVLKKVYEAFVQVGGLVGDIVDDIFNGIGGGLLDVFEEALPLIQLALNHMKAILDLIGTALSEVVSVIKDAKAIYSVLREKKASELPKAIAQGLGRAVVNDLEGAAGNISDFFGGFGKETLGGVADFVRDDVIGGKADEDAMSAARERLDTTDGDFSGHGSGGEFTGAGGKYNPLLPPVRVQNFGLEEAFKKAQQGASFDPTKIAENERKKIAIESRDYLKSISEKVTPESAAAGAF
ncbi:hypothetical protein GobsT_18600 [Gemmata obscuriglobus]|uniref:Phage tail tape measure protein n=1 Tax=Gemmata obscuriglobus TaxID=114 RepID=A0A2Z3H219_9BACT|nr:hypothetical protein [Gemmata obscuriglobus]AWM39778.1 hypothetical protein C1280_24085 [Gemmata obscuriglobus]QEG27107.1 hypothetical protein GobsT_18600 [Gemmata obscuriglobus]VTS03616.1 unnamed protein product [Gemmata obscuriglobus UQM 2246]